MSMTYKATQIGKSCRLIASSDLREWLVNHYNNKISIHYTSENGTAVVDVDEAVFVIVAMIATGV